MPENSEENKKAWKLTRGKRKTGIIKILENRGNKEPHECNNSKAEKEAKTHVNKELFTAWDDRKCESEQVIGKWEDFGKVD
jgi:hypothetical protein